MVVGVQHDAILADEKDKPVKQRGFLALLNDGLFKLSAASLVVAAVVLTFGVTSGHVMGRAVIWQDEVTIFLVVGAIFLSSAYVQSKRGHVGIEVLSSYLSPETDRLRHLVVDAVAFCFVAIFAFQAGYLLQEAVVEGQSTHSAWGPPLWIPYLLLTFGMIILALQLGQQVGERSLATLAVAAVVVCGLLTWNYWLRGPLPVLAN